MWNNFQKTAVLKKLSVVNYIYKAKDCPRQFLGRTCADFFIYLSVIFLGLAYRQMYRKFKKVVLGLLVHLSTLIFFSRILSSEALVYKSYFFQKSRFTDIIRH